jgi:hypothetical protein
MDPSALVLVAFYLAVAAGVMFVAAHITDPDTPHVFAAGALIALVWPVVSILLAAYGAFVWARRAVAWARTRRAA